MADPTSDTAKHVSSESTSKGKAVLLSAKSAEVMDEDRLDGSLRGSPAWQAQEANKQQATNNNGGGG